jgi:hypothetical protein
MPVIKKQQPPETPHYRKLVATLVKELRSNKPTGPKTAPQIIEEEDRHNFLHVNVIWDAWNDVAPEDRGRIIMDAYEQERHDDVQRITVALGLTHAESKRLGVTT